MLTTLRILDCGILQSHHGGVPTASEMATALPSHVLHVLHDGMSRDVTGVELIDVDLESVAHPGDLLLAVIPQPDLIARLDALSDHTGPPAAGLVVRRSLVDDDLVHGCERLDITLIALADGISWSLAIGLFQTALERERHTHPSDTMDDLFALAEQIEEAIDAPVTIEDADSRVLAYSSRQDDTDEARVSTIIGRRVPREVRAHFRAHGVFRRLASTDEPFLVEGFMGGETTPWVRPRFVVPVRAGGTWLGSIWAVTDEPITGDRLAALLGAADLVALHLLRLRSRRELTRQISVEQVRGALRGESVELPLPPPPWRAAVLSGLSHEQPAESRREMWHALLRRNGWPDPLLADLGDDVLVLAAANGAAPGGWEWLQTTIRRVGTAAGAVSITAGPVVKALHDLPGSCALAIEQTALPRAAVSTTDDLWPLLTVRRAVTSLDGLPDPLHALREYDAERGTELLTTLRVVLDHWAEPRRSAARLGVHPNTVRYRVAQVSELLGTTSDLGDPELRFALAVWCRT